MARGGNSGTGGNSSGNKYGGYSSEDYASRQTTSDSYKAKRETEIANENSYVPFVGISKCYAWLI
jgi:hypothetical protein